MKRYLPGTEIEVRADYPIERLDKFEGWAGECKHCKDGIVKMPRENYVIQPGKCWCLLCGQHYFVEIKELFAVWENKQWMQKK